MIKPLLFFFLLLTLTLFLPVPWLVIGFGGMLAYYAVRYKSLGKAVPDTTVNLFIVILLLGVMLGLLVTPTPLKGVASTANVLAAITCFYILTDFIKTPADAWIVAAGLVVLGLGITLLVPFDVAWSLDKVYPLPWLAQLTPPSTGLNPNLIAGMLAVILPIAVSLLFTIRWRILGAVVLVPLLLSLIVLQSRGALFGVAGGLALAAAAFRRWLVLLLVLLVLVGLTVNYFSGGESPAPIVLGRVGTATSGTTLERLALWRQALDLIRERPMTGIGMAAYPSVAPYAPPYSPTAPGPREPHPHNLFLQVAVNAGLPGLTGFILVLLSATVSAWRAYARGILPPLALGILAALGVVIVHGLVDSIFWGNKGSLILWVLFALGLSLPHLTPSLDSRSPGGN